MSKRNPPAFPVPNSQNDGMSQRDWFAGQALVALASEMLKIDTSTSNDLARDLAEMAYDLADAMMKAREGGA